jgi:hypothetical protein
LALGILALQRKMLLASMIGGQKKKKKKKKKKAGRKRRVDDCGARRRVTRLVQHTTAKLSTDTVFEPLAHIIIIIINLRP